MKPPRAESLAIVGMACRFPGAPSLSDFWTLLCQGLDSITRVPAQRWDAPAMFNVDTKVPGAINTLCGGFIEDVDRFDAAFFGISPREARQMDPQQRILLELAYEAIENAGLSPTALGGTDTAVYVGAMTNDYLRHQTADGYRHIDVHSGSGTGLCMLANRLSYQFDLRGPSATVDSACSSSLVAVFQACQSLWTGQSRLALAAGINVMLDPAFNVFYTKAGLSAPDGRCKTFSAAADGIGRAEGAGVVVLKRLQDALTDKDAIYAVIRGGAVNHDGRSNGLTQPNRWAQEQLLRCAFDHAGVLPSELDYVELHGTGTLIGDPIEANALADALTQARERSSPCLVGSVKTNIGHLEAAAGIAGLIKLALSISQARIPASLWFDAANPHIAFDRLPIRVNTQCVPWSGRNERRLGGVSSFGLGGTNAHLVLESAPSVPGAPPSPSASADQWLFVSARSENALKQLVAQYVEFLTSLPESSLPAVCSTALRRKGMHDFRVSAIGRDKAAIVEGLQAFLAGVDDPRIVHGRYRPSQRGLLLAAPEHSRIDTRRLARWIAAAPIARQAWNDCRATLIAHGMLALPAADALGMHPEVTAGDADFGAWHFAGQFALLKQAVSSAGAVESIIADGLGQLAAFCAADAISMTTAVRWLGDGLSREFPVAQGLQDPNYAIACDCPMQRNPSLDAVDWHMQKALWLGRLDESVRNTNADVLMLNMGEVCGIGSAPEEDAIQSLALDGDADSFQHMCARLSLRHQLNWRACADDNDFVRLPAYPWQRESFWLPREVTGQAAKEADVARPVLAPPNARIFEDAVGAASVLSDLRDTREGDGAPDGGKGPDIDRVCPLEHELLGQRADMPMPVWENRLNASHLPYLQDHRVQGVVVLPGSAYAEIGLAIHHALSCHPQGVLENMEFHKALVIEERQEPTLRVIYDEETRGYAVYSQRRKGKKWTLHARGKLSMSSLGEPQPVNLQAIQDRCTEFIDGETHYANMRGRGFEYGRYFQGVRRLWLGTGVEEVLAWIEGHEALADHDHGNRLHPTTFDASLQTLLTPLGAKGDTELYIPIGIRQLKLYGVPKNGFWCYGKLKQRTQGTAEGDVVLFDQEGNVLAEALGVRAQALTRKNQDELKQIDQWLYEFAWEQKAPNITPVRAGRWLVFVDAAGHGERLAEQLAAAGAEQVIRVRAAETFQQRDEITFLMAPASKPDMQRMMNKARAAEVEGIVYCWGLDAPNEEGDVAGISAKAVPAVNLIQALSREYSANPPRLIIVTRGAQSVGKDDPVETVATAPLIGLVRVAVNECPELRLRTIDIDRNSDTLACLTAEIMSDCSEDELALRGARRYVRRMVRKPALNWDREPAKPSDASTSHTGSANAGASICLGSGAHDEPQREPEPQEVEIALQWATLDQEAATQNASASLARLPQGLGVVTRVGKDVRQVQPGSDVFVWLNGKPGPYVTVPSAAVFLLPKNCFTEIQSFAAYLPALVRVHYALHHVARLQAGERLFVQEAASPTGLAAIQIARCLGASVYAMDTGPERLRYLRSLGIDGVFDGRSLDFVDRIMEGTEGRGLDVVLNALSGELAAKTLALLAPFGRFVDLSNRNGGHLAVAQSAPSNRSVAEVDIHQLMVERKELFAQVLAEVCERYSQDNFFTLPMRVFSPAEEMAAIGAMDASDRIGGVAISFQHYSDASLPQNRLFQADGTYLITGGFGGFGLEIAAWMVGEGVRNMALVGRHGAMSDTAQQAVNRLRRRGVRVLCVAADVSEESDVTKLIAEIGRSMPPLKGVFHLAAVLDDGPVNRVDSRQIENVMRPKANGAWHLHRHTLDSQLDYFVLFSSIASMVGGPGQATYAMACAYLDGLAHYRRGRNLPATAIHWGALGGVGMAAQHSGVEQYLSSTGVKSFTPAQAVKLLGRILHWNPVELGVADMDWGLWGGVYPAWAASPKYGALAVAEEVTEAQSAQSTQVQSLLGLQLDARPAAITVILAELLAATLQTTPEKIDCDLSLLSMGVDSLMAMDLQVAIERCLTVKVSTLELMKGNTLTQLAQHVALKISSPGAAEPDGMPFNSSGKLPDQPGLSTELDLENAERVISRLNDLTDEEVDRLIEKMMAKEEIEA